MLKFSIVNRNDVINVLKRYDFANSASVLNDIVQPNENYAFQIVAESDKDCELILDSETSESLFCINFGGFDYKGNAFCKNAELKNGVQQILWFGVHVPIEADGAVEYKAVLSCDGEKYEFNINLNVGGDVLTDCGVSKPEKFSRLGWFNSTLAQNDTVTKGYIPVKMDGNTISILGRKLVIADSGFPAAIYSYFNKNIKLTDTAHQITDEIKLIFRDSGGSIIDFKNSGIEVASISDSHAAYTVVSEGKGLTAVIKGDVEFDGFVGYEIEVKAEEDITLSDVSINVPYIEPFERYCIGLGQKGGCRPQKIDFKWNPEYHQNSIWTGDINGGLRCEFKGEDFVPPLVNIYYKHRPYHMPKSFCNDGKGGIVFEGRTLCAYSGSHTLKKGETLRFDFDMMITPLKEMDMSKRLRTHYYHAEADLEKAKSEHATCFNLHHAEKENPFINYPFLRNELLKSAADKFHDAGIKFKVYYTMRELSDRAAEWQAMRSLGDEIFPRPNGSLEGLLWDDDGRKWFAENLGSDLIPAWQTQYDNAAITEGDSRLANYYIEGLDWLIKNIGIDGIYVDDTSFNRLTMRRARRILEQVDEPLIDLHSWNHYCKSAGFANSLNIYMTLLPYIDSVWIGESFDHHGESPDFWITEIIGLPYGVTPELLQQGKIDEIFRGMLFGATSRLGYLEGATVELIKFIDEYKLADKEMWGFWNEETSVRSDNPEVYATLYKGEKQSVVVLAAWNDYDKPLTVNLGFKGYLPEIKDLQSYAEFNGSITLNKGAIIVTDEKII